MGCVAAGIGVTRRAGRREVVSDLAAISRDVRALIAWVALAGVAALLLIVVSALGSG